MGLLQEIPDGFYGPYHGPLRSPAATTVRHRCSLLCQRPCFSSVSVSVLFGSLKRKSKNGNGIWKTKQQAEYHSISSSTRPVALASHNCRPWHISLYILLRCAYGFSSLSAGEQKKKKKKNYVCLYDIEIEISSATQFVSNEYFNIGFVHWTEGVMSVLDSSVPCQKCRKSFNFVVQRNVAESQGEDWVKRGYSGARGLISFYTSSILASRSLEIVLDFLLPEIFPLY